MIASFSNGFIFLKTRKTGGTSAEIVLSTWLSGNDICSPINSSDEKLRESYRGWKPTKEYRGKKIYNHMPALEVIPIFPDLWRDAFKFTVERHPYEKAVSLAYHMSQVRLGYPPTARQLEEYLEKVISEALFLDRSIYCEDNKLLVDEVIHYDKLWSRLAELAKLWGQSMPEELPNAKSQYRLDRTPARDVLNKDQKRRIQDVAAFEFEVLSFSD